MPLALDILHWFIICLPCLLLLIRIHIIAILSLVPVDIPGSQVKPTMTSVLHILRWSIIDLWCLFLLILIHIVAILILIPVDITRSQVKPLEFSRNPSSPSGIGVRIVLVIFVSCVFLIPAASWHPEMQFVIRALLAIGMIGSVLLITDSSSTT